MLFTFGNKKLPEHTAIFNMNPATECPAKKFCQLRNLNRCYALKAERLYPNVRKHREGQKKFWETASVDKFIEKLMEEKKNRVIKYLRFNVSGDFRHQRDVKKAVKIAKKLQTLGIITYLYTARRDLDYNNHEPLIINGSGFMVDNAFIIGKGKIQCPMNCRICNMCTKKENKIIHVKLH